MTQRPTTNQAFPKRERVRKRAEYLAIQGEGKKLHSDGFLVFVRPRAATADPGVPTRVGITVSRRVGNAVVRNRVKRLVREAYRHHKSEFPTGVDVVFVAKQRAAQTTADLASVEREVVRLWARRAR